MPTVGLVLGPWACEVPSWKQKRKGSITNYKYIFFLTRKTNITIYFFGVLQAELNSTKKGETNFI